MEFERVQIGNTSINFPFTPYPLQVDPDVSLGPLLSQILNLQVDYMTAVLRCLDSSQNGLLESPTGTGV